MTTTAARDRLEAIKERRRTAIGEKNRYTKLRDAARETGDADAEAVADMGLATANDEYQVPANCTTR